LFLRIVKDFGAKHLETRRPLSKGRSARTSEFLEIEVVTSVGVEAF
jgi:hypothetical protein